MKRREFMDHLKFGALGAAFAARTRPQEKSPEIGQPFGRGSRDARLEVNLNLIGLNYDRVRNKAGVPVMAVVKANAYGHGLVEVGKYLERKGAAALMTGKLEEALRLRENGVRCPIANFGPFGPDDAAAIVKAGITQSVSHDVVRALAEEAAKSGRKALIDIHVDTGLNRAGIPWGRAFSFIEETAGLANVEIKGISTAFTEDPEFDREQLRRFLDVCGKARGRGIEVGLRHAASSAALFSGPEFALDMIRPGIALYGYYPNARTRREDALGLAPALRLIGRVTFVNDLAAGETISYLRAYKAGAPTRVATVGLGYSDGYPPAAGGKARVRIGAKTFPVLPAVTANHVMIDLRDDRSVKVGDEVVLIDNTKGSPLAADALGETIGVSDYKLLIGLNPHLPRFFKSEE